MAHFAKVKNGIVTNIIVAEAEFFDTYIDSEPGEWIETSYNTFGGIHKLGGTPLRKNFAGFNYIRHIRTPTLFKGGVGDVFFNAADGDSAKVVI